MIHRVSERDIFLLTELVMRSFSTGLPELSDAGFSFEAQLLVEIRPGVEAAGKRSNGEWWVSGKNQVGKYGKKWDNPNITFKFKWKNAGILVEDNGS